MTFDELLQKHHIVQAKPIPAQPPPPFYKGTVYRINDPDGLLDHLHGSYIKILDVYEARVHYIHLTHPDNEQLSSTFTHTSYFARHLNYVASSFTEYVHLMAI